MNIPITILFFYLVYCSYTDIKKRIVYIYPTISICVIIFLTSLFNIINNSGNIIDYFLSFIPGIILVFLSYATKENIGYGDSILLLLCCISTNHKDGMFIIILSFIYSASYSIIMLITGKSGKDTIPFVPFIFLGFISNFLIKY